MKQYESPQPRVACGIAALFMTAATIGLMVVLPSKIEADSQAFAMIAVANAAAPNTCAGAR